MEAGIAGVGSARTYVFLALCVMVSLPVPAARADKSTLADSCVAISCPEPEGDCWEGVRALVEAGERLGRAGDQNGAITCFTRAANSVRDEQWLPQPQRLGGVQRLLLSRFHHRPNQLRSGLRGLSALWRLLCTPRPTFMSVSDSTEPPARRLYSGASHVLLKAGAPVEEVQVWLRRAVQIASPSVHVLFDDDAAAAGASNDTLEYDDDRGQCDEEALAREGRWALVARCLKERAVRALEAAAEDRASMHERDVLEPARWLQLGFACVLAGDAAAARPIAQTVEPSAPKPREWPRRSAPGSAPAGR